MKGETIDLGTIEPLGYAGILVALSFAAMEERRTSMEEMGKLYENGAFRLAITFTEILPIGLLVALISAAILRRKEVLPEVEPT